MSLKSGEKKKILGRLGRLRNGCLITFKKYKGSHLRCSIKKLFFNKFRNIHRTDRKPPVIFKSTYFEEHLRIAASENVFMKLRKIKNYS